MAECFLCIVGITKIYSEKQKTATIQEMFGPQGTTWMRREPLDFTYRRISNY